MASKEYQDRVNEMLVRQLGNNICRLLDEFDDRIEGLERVMKQDVTLAD